MALLNGVRYPRARPGTQRLARTALPGDPFGALAAAAPAPPTVRLWPFATEETTPGDIIVTSPDFHGPAVIDSIFLTFDEDNTSPRPTISLWYGASQPTSRSGTTADPSALGTSLFTTSSIQTEGVGGYQGTIQQIPKFAYGVGKTAQPYRLGVLVRLERFQITVVAGTSGAGLHAVAGYVRVLESIAAGELARWL